MKLRLKKRSSEDLLEEAVELLHMIHINVCQHPVVYVSDELGNDVVVTCADCSRVWIGPMKDMKKRFGVRRLQNE